MNLTHAFLAKLMKTEGAKSRLTFKGEISFVTDGVIDVKALGTDAETAEFIINNNCRKVYLKLSDGSFLRFLTKKNSARIVKRPRY